jgi:hypothetical protein
MSSTPSLIHSSYPDQPVSHPSTPPDVVLGIMKDIDLLTGWLTEDLPITRAPDGTVTTHIPSGITRYRVRPGNDTPELYWTSEPDADGWTGRAVLRALPVGGSVIDVRLGVPVAFRTRISHIDEVVSHLLRRVDAEAERRSVMSNR